MRKGRLVAVIAAAALLAGLAGGHGAEARSRTTTRTFAGGTVIIPAGAPGTTSGPGAPNPSPLNITVARGLRVKILDVNVIISGYSHTFPDDVDVLLVGPNGANSILMSDVGGSTDINNGTITLDDQALGGALSDAGPLTSGTFLPTNIGAGDTFTGATASGNTLLSVFNGISPRGTWNLFVQDDAGGDVGQLSWSLQITAKVKKH